MLVLVPCESASNLCDLNRNCPPHSLQLPEAAPLLAVLATSDTAGPDALRAVSVEKWSACDSHLKITDPFLGWNLTSVSTAVLFFGGEICCFILQSWKWHNIGNGGRMNWFSWLVNQGLISIDRLLKPTLSPTLDTSLILWKWQKRTTYEGVAIALLFYSYLWNPVQKTCSKFEKHQRSRKSNLHFNICLYVKPTWATVQWYSLGIYSKLTKVCILLAMLLRSAVWFTQSLWNSCMWMRSYHCPERGDDDRAELVLYSCV